MKLDEAKNTGIAVATASIFNDVKLQINSNITDNYKRIWYYIAEAIANAQNGLKISFNQNTNFNIPIELQNELDADSLLNTAFQSLSKGQQRLYSEYIASAKRPQTKERRIYKIIPMIREGIGLHDKYK